MAPLAQELYPQVERGHECDISIDGLRNKVFRARVSSKDPAVDTASRQFNIRVKIYDPKGMVRPGMFARVHLELGSRDAQLTIPTAALQDKNDKQQSAVVYRVVNHQVQRANLRFLWAGPTDTIVENAVVRPVANWMRILIFLLLGAVAFTRLPLDLLPEVVQPSLFVVTTWPGVSPEDLETQITRQVEDAVSTVAGLSVYLRTLPRESLR